MGLACHTSPSGVLCVFAFKARVLMSPAAACELGSLLLLLLLMVMSADSVTKRRVSVERSIMTGSTGLVDNGQADDIYCRGGGGGGGSGGAVPTGPSCVYAWRLEAPLSVGLWAASKLLLLLAAAAVPTGPSCVYAWRLEAPLSVGLWAVVVVPPGGGGGGGGGGGCRLAQSRCGESESIGR